MKNANNCQPQTIHSIIDNKELYISTHIYYYIGREIGNSKNHVITT